MGQPDKAQEPAPGLSIVQHGPSSSAAAPAEAPGSLTAQTLQQLEQSASGTPQPPAAASQQQGAAQEHTGPVYGVHQRSLLGPTTRNYSATSSCSSAALLGRMSGVSLQRPDFATGPMQQQQQQQVRQSLEQQAGQQGLVQPTAHVMGQQQQSQQLQLPAGGSASSSPPLSPSRAAGRHGSARPSADGGSPHGGGASVQPIPQQALGLPAIATTLPVPIPGSSPPTAGGLSPHAVASPRGSVRGLNITPQASAAAALSHATSLAVLAATHAQQQQQVVVAVSAGGTLETDEDLDSSSDDDDNYEFGEQKIKRTFTRQQRRQRREQQLLAQQQQQQQQQQAATLLQQQQLQAQVQALLQQQQQQTSELQEQLLLQQVAGGSNPLSPTAAGGSPAGGFTAEALAAVAEAAAAAAGAGASSVSASVQPQLGGSPRDAAGNCLGSAQSSTAGAAAAAAAAAAAVGGGTDCALQLVAEQQALLASIASQQQQQQQQPYGAAGGAGELGTAASLDSLLQQAAPAIDWATAVPLAAAAATAAAATAAAAGAPVGSAGASAEPSFVPVLEQTVSGVSAVSGTSGKSSSKPAAAGGGAPAVSSLGGAPAGAWLRGAGAAGGGGPADVAGSVGSARGLNILGSSLEPVAGSGSSFLARQQQQQGGGGGGAGAAGSAGGAAGVEGVKKEQGELQAEFQGLSLFNEEDDDDEGEGEEEHIAWYRRPMVWFRIVAFSLSGVLLIMGILTQNVQAMRSMSNAGVDLFRWMYFFAAWPALWMTVSFLTDKLFAFIEWWFYREALFYLDSVRRTARGLIFMCLVLPWFVLCFWELWCGDTQCEADTTYKKATDVVWRLMVCLTLFSLANFLKSVLTKLLSSHFYKTAHFMKVKAAIEKEYWLLMLSQPRPAPKPISEPPLSRLSHFVYNGAAAGGDDGGGGGGQADEGGVVPGADSDTGSKLRRRNRLSKPSGDLSKPGLLTKSVNFFSRRDSSRPTPSRAVSCGALGEPSTRTGSAQAAALSAALGGHELTLSNGAAAGLAQAATGARAAAAAAAAAAGADSNNGPLSPDFTARIVVSGFNIEALDAARGSPHLDPSPSSFTTAQPAAAAAAGFAAAGGFGDASATGQTAGQARVGSLSAQLQPGQQDSAVLDRARSSSLRWTHHEAEAAAAAAAAGAGTPSEVNLQPFKGQADRFTLYSGSDAEADDKGAQKGSRWGFWKKLTSGKEEQQLLPEGHSPSSPASQLTLVIQDSLKPVEGSCPSKQWGSSPSSVFASPLVQQQQQQHSQQRLAVSRLNSALLRKPGSRSVSVRQRSTDVGGAAGTVAAGGSTVAAAAAAKVAAPAAGSAAAVTSDPLLQPGVLEAVNLKVDGKAVDTSTITPQAWERLRAGIALKTFTALMKRYQNLSDAEEAKKLRDARRFAKGLFHHVRGGCSRPYVVRDDFAPFFACKESADAAFAFFDKDNDATLSLKEMKDSVAAIFKERKNMAASLKDTDSIVNTLEFGIGFLLHFIFAAIYLLVWGMDILKGFSTFSSVVLAMTFMFGNSVRQIFESLLFLFVEHAFDVGDLLEVELIAYRVKKIDLMYTVLVKSTGERCYFPNTRLITLPVVNLTRSCARSEKVVVSLNVGQASNAAREALLAAVKEHYEENESDFNSCPSVNFVNLVDPFKAQLSVTWTYNFGADESKRTSTVKTGLLQVIHSTLGSLPNLEYTLVKDNRGTGASGEAADDDDDAAQHQRSDRAAASSAAALGAGVAEQQAARVATMGAAALGVGMLGGTAMMGTAGLAML